MSTDKKQEKQVDEAVEATFPASDPPGHGGKDVGPDKLANFDALIEKKNAKVPATRK